jgi:hypothetical protein
MHYMLLVAVVTATGSNTLVAKGLEVLPEKNR